MEVKYIFSITILLLLLVVGEVDSKADHLDIISLGCYKLQRHGQPQFLQVVNEHKTVKSVEQCVDYCGTHEYRLAGIQNGNLCKCRNGGVADLDKGYRCQMTCSDDQNSCGGRDISVYPRKYSTTELGCYYGGVTSTLTRIRWVSLSKCISYCFSEGYKYAGLQNNIYCKCDTTSSVLTSKGKRQNGCPQWCYYSSCSDTIIVYEINVLLPTTTPQPTTSPKSLTKGSAEETTATTVSGTVLSERTSPETTSSTTTTFATTTTTTTEVTTTTTATPRATQSGITTTNYHNTSEFHIATVSTLATENISAARNDNHLANSVKQQINDGPNLGLYIGSGVGGVVGCAIIIAVFVIIYLRRKASASQAQISDAADKYNNPAYTGDSKDDIEGTTPRLPYDEEDYAQINKPKKSTNPVALPTTTSEVEKLDTVIYENSADDMDSSVYYSTVYQTSADDRSDELVYSLAEPIEDDLVVEENELYGT